MNLSTTPIISLYLTMNITSSILYKNDSSKHESIIMNIYIYTNYITILDNEYN